PGDRCGGGVWAVKRERSGKEGVPSTEYPVPRHGLTGHGFPVSSSDFISSVLGTQYSVLRTPARIMKEPLMDTSERSERGARLVEKMLGPDQAERVRQAWKQICPDFEKYVIEFLAGEIWSRPQLDLRTRSLVTVAALAATGRALGLELNIRM